MAAQPDRWEYPHDVGFVHYRDGDYRQAAEWFQRAADARAPKEGERADIWLRPLAANTLATGGDTQVVARPLRALLDVGSRLAAEDAARRLKQLDAIDQIAELERLTREYEQQFGDPPPHVGRPGARRLSARRAARSGGHPYVLNPWWGDVTVERGLADLAAADGEIPRERRGRSSSRRCSAWSSAAS